MEPEAVPPPQELWWAAVVLAALHRLTGRPGCRFEPDTHVVRLDPPDGGWLRLQRCRGDRYVLWGRSTLAPPAPRDARRDVPDWALSPATDERRPTFVAWWAHGEWDVASEADEGVPQLLRPLLTVDPRLTSLAAADRLTAADLTRDGTPDHYPDVVAAVAVVRAATAPPPALPRGSVRSRLRDQVHGHMRAAAETDRMLLHQPPELVRWAQVHRPGSGLSHAVMSRRGQLVPAVTNTALPRAARRTLAAVLEQLHRQESSSDHGAWLFARVSATDGVIGLDRAFDHWPTWWRVAHASHGPSLEDLAWEMAQRAPAWRPGWAGLLGVPDRASEGQTR